MKKCCWQGCDMAFEPILTSFDDEKERIVLCPNHAAQYVYVISKGEKPDIIPLPSQIEQSLDVCDACGEKETVLYQTTNYGGEPLDINLCQTHLHRLFARKLEPKAFKALYQKHGEFHEIHDDFYDPESGFAFQPMDIDI